MTARETGNGNAGYAAAPLLRTLLRTLATYREPRLVAVLFMGFSSGLPLALTAGTLQVWQTRAGVDLATIGFFALVGVVYSLKFIWAPFMDRIALPWPLGRLGRRRGWAILTQIGLAVSILFLGASDPAIDPTLTAVFAVFVAFCSASQDVVVDAYRIELLDDAQQGAGAAMTQWGYRGGMLASGAGALWLHGDGDGLSWFGVYLVMASLVSVGIVTVLMTREPSDRRRLFSSSTGADTKGWYAAVLLLIALGAVGSFLAVKYWLFGGVTIAGWARWSPNISAIAAAAAVPVALILAMPKPASPTSTYGQLHSWLDQSVIAPFRDVARHQGWGLILLFVVLFKLGDAFAGVMANPFYVQVGFTDVEIASVSKVFGVIATLVGVLIGGLLIVRVGLFKSLLIGGVLQMLSNLMFAVQAEVGHDVNFLMLTIGLENLSGGIGSAAFVAYLSGLCNVAFTGTQYALLTSLAAIGRTVLSSPGGQVAEAVGWFDFFLLSTVLAAPGLLLLLWMMRRYPPPTLSSVPRGLDD